MKKIKYVICGFIFFLVCGFVVNAAMQTVKNVTNHSVESGLGNAYVNLKSNYDYAAVRTSPTKVGSGTKKTVIIGYKNSNGTLINRTSKTIAISTDVSRTANLGKLTKGTWVIRNNAFEGNTNYAGWSGTLTVVSSNQEIYF